MKVKTSEGLLNKLFENNKTRIHIKIDEGLTNEEFVQTFTGELERASEDISNDILKEIIDKRKTLSNRYDRSLRGFKKRLRRRWSKPFHLLNILHILTQELGAKMWNELSPTLAEDDYLPFVLIKLHGRACQIGGEILTLLQSGYGDGALSRWRSLHETVITAFFIEKHGSRTAEKYLKYTVIDSYRAYPKYQEYCERLEMDPLSQEDIDSINEATEELCREFGDSYKRPNGWASEELEIDSPRFNQIEAEVDFSHYRPWYKMASLHTHSSPKTMEFSLGLYDGREVIIAGPSNVGLTDPGQNMAISLNHINALLLSLPVSQETLFEAMVSLQVLYKLCQEVIDSLFTVEEEIAKDEEILSKTEIENLPELKEYLIVSIKDFFRSHL